MRMSFLVLPSFDSMGRLNKFYKSQALNALHQWLCGLPIALGVAATGQQDLVQARGEDGGEHFAN
jgi:hypothetical protein